MRTGRSGVAVNCRAWSPLKPFWPCSARVNVQPDAGVPNAACGTAMVIVFAVWDATTAAVPTWLPVRVDPDRRREALHLEALAPRRRRRDRVVARRVGAGGGRRRCSRPPYEHVEQLRAERAAEGRRQVAQRGAQVDRRVLGQHLEAGDVEGAVAEGRRARVLVGARAVVVARRVADVVDARAADEFADDGGLRVAGTCGGRGGRGDHVRPEPDGDVRPSSRRRARPWSRRTRWRRPCRSDRRTPRRARWARSCP